MADAPIDLEAIKQRYPMYAFLVNDPQIGPILQDAYSGKIQPDDFQAKIMATDWWKQNSQSVRNWQTLQNTDPETANARRRAKEATIWDQAKKMGFDISVPDTQQIALDSLQQGWSDSQVNDVLVSKMQFGANTGGDAGATMGQLRQIAGQYAVPLSQDTLNTWGKQILAGEQDTQSFNQYALNQAKSLFGGNPDLVSALDRGTTVRQYADPYLQIAQSDLGINPESIDLSDPKWSKALVNVNKDGTRAAMNLNDWRTEIRTNPTYGFDQSDTGRQTAAQLSQQLAQKFGAVA